MYVLDGIGIRLAKTAGIEVAVLSGMDVPCVVRRLEVLGVTEYHGGADNKCTILDGMRKRMSLEWQEIAYLGDDWVDLAPMSRVGLPAAVANAMPDVKKLAKFVTQKEGGCGAVREFVDLLLTCQGKHKPCLSTGCAWNETFTNPAYYRAGGASRRRLVRRETWRRNNADRQIA